MEDRPGYESGMETQLADRPIIPPPAREPRAIKATTRTYGLQVAVGSWQPEIRMILWERGLVAASDPYEGEGGRLFVNVVHPEQWYRWVFSEEPDKTPHCPRAKAWPASHVYLE